MKRLRLLAGARCGLMLAAVLGLAAATTNRSSAASSEGQAVLSPGDPVSVTRRALLDASDPTMVIVAHRGHMKTAPENSLQAIRDTAEAGAGMAEIDIRRSADGVYVLMHDATINRTTDMKGEVSQLKLQELRAARLKHGQRPTSEPVPTLDEAFEAARGRVMLNLDPKDISLPEVVGLARKAGMLHHCLLKGNWGKLDEASKAFVLANPDVLFMPICGSLEEVREVLKIRAWPIVEVTFAGNDDPLLDRDVVTGLRKGGTRLWVNTLQGGRISGGLSDRLALEKPDAVFGRLRDIGYGAIQTDLPDVAAAYYAKPK